MELKDQVQGVVLGLFGAYAGGYLADLTSQAENGNPVELAAGLVSLQTPLLGVDLADDSVWVDTILGHLGVSSTSAAYTAAAAWANGELDAGASRANVIIAAVAYLLGDDVEAQYADVATAFKADVAAGVEWSEGDGKDVLGIADLRVEAGNPATGSSFNLTAALAELFAAQEAETEFVDAWGEANDVDPVDAADIADALEDAELLLENSALNTADYLESDTASVKAAKIAVIQAELDAALTDAQDDLAASTEAVSAVTGLKTAIDRFVTAYGAAEDASEAASDADAANTAAYNAAETYFVAVDGELSSNDYIVDAGTGEAVVLDTLTAAALVTAGLTAGQAAEYLAALQALADADNALFAADEAAADALTVVNTRLDSLEDLGVAAPATILAANVDGDLADPEAADFLTDVDAAAYAADAEAVAAAEADLEDFAELLADIDAAQDDVDALEALTDAVDAVEETLLEEGYFVNTAAAGGVISTVDEDEVDVIVLSQLEGADTVEIENFGLIDSDILYFGEQAFDLVQLADDEDITDAVGDAAALEIFWEEVAGDLVLYVETETFGGNLADDQELVTVTLVGFSAAEIGSFNGTILTA